MVWGYERIEYVWEIMSYFVFLRYGVYGGWGIIEKLGGEVREVSTC